MMWKFYDDATNKKIQICSLKHAGKKIALLWNMHHKRVFEVVFRFNHLLLLYFKYDYNTVFTFIFKCNLNRPE